MIPVPINLIHRSSDEDIRGMIEMCNKWFAFHGRENKPTNVSNPLEMVKNGRENQRRKFVLLMVENCERILAERNQNEKNQS